MSTERSVMVSLLRLSALFAMVALRDVVVGRLSWIVGRVFFVSQRSVVLSWHDCRVAPIIG